MSRRSDSAVAAASRRRSQSLPAAIATLGAVAFAAAAAVAVAGTGGAIAGIAASPDSAPRSDASYRLRCWQFGRLLFDEIGVRLPVDAAGSGLKLRGYDRNGAPVYVTETENATCLVRREPALPAPQRGYRSVP